jgi:hypothetical protein
LAKTDSRLLAALRKKLGGVSLQAIHQRRAKLQGLVPMFPDIATYVIAQREGLRLDKYIKDLDVLSAVAAADARLRAIEEASETPKRRASTSKQPTRMTRVTKVSIAGKIETEVPGLSATHAKEATAMAERVYPTLYLFENSVRDFVECVLSAKYGDDWWTSAVPPKVQEVAQKHKESEASDPWHGRRGAREIDYVFLGNLWDIIKHLWPDFKRLFPNQAWVEHLIKNDMNVSRNVIAHMNPLGEDDIKNIEAAYHRWVKQLQAIQKKLS